MSGLEKAEEKPPRAVRGRRVRDTYVIDDDPTPMRTEREQTRTWLTGFVMLVAVGGFLLVQVSEAQGVPVWSLLLPSLALVVPVVRRVRRRD